MQLQSRKGHHWQGRQVRAIKADDLASAAVADEDHGERGVEQPRWQATVPALR